MTSAEATTLADAPSSTETNAAPPGDYAKRPAALAEAMQTQFASRDELLAYVTEFCLAQGFAVVIHKSNLPRGQLWLRCDLGGSAPVEPSPQVASSSTSPAPLSTIGEPECAAKPKRKRRPSQRFQSCPFQLYGRRLTDGVWVLKVQNELHTHPLASRKQDLVMHPKARRLSNGQKRMVMEMTDLGIRPSVILERLKARFPDKPIKVQDIYNARNHIRMERLAGREPFPEARESDGDTGEGTLDANTNEVPNRRVRMRPPPLSDELRSLWSTIVSVVPHWPLENQSAFVRNVHALLASPNGATAVMQAFSQSDTAIEGLNHRIVVEIEAVPDVVEGNESGASESTSAEDNQDGVSGHEDE